jgi:Fic family protein
MNNIDISSLIITPEMLAIIAEIDEFKGAWKLLGRLAPERLQALKKVATIESVGSSTRIEGAKLSDSDVEKLLSNLNTRSFRSRDEQEVGGYAVVCEEIFNNFEHIPFTENIIKQLHAWLLQYSTKDQRHRGEYKKFPNHVETFDPQGKSLGVVFETTPPFETPFKMQELVHWTREALETKSLHPLLVIGIFIVEFLAIHPFQDGNGRLSRILTTLLLLKAGYLYVPYSSLESVIEDNKESYYLALRRTQKTLGTEHQNFNPWLIFFLRSLQKQKRLLEQKIAREKILAMELPELSEQIIKLLQEHGRLSTAELIKLTKISRNTLKKYLTELTEAQHIIRHGKGRSTWYTLP